MTTLEIVGAVVGVIILWILGLGLFIDGDDDDDRRF
jgi:hypothetical protein